MRIVVFGAGGFVGGWVCEELSLRSDVEQVACVRKWASAVRLARRGIPIMQVDLENCEGLPDVLAGADAVVNATMPAPQREADLVAGLYAASISAGVRRFVQFSSAAVYGNCAGTVDESIPPSPTDGYSRGKVAMESRLARAASGSGTQVVILRPSIIYGPFSDGWTVRYVKRIACGRWRGLGRAGDGTCNLIHAQDVARAAIAAATANLPPGVHILNLNGPERVTWNEYIARLGDALEMPNRVIPSVARFRLMASAAEMLRVGARYQWVRSLYKQSTGTTRAAMTNAKAVTALYPTAGELNLLRRKVHYVAERAPRILGVSPSVSLEQGVRESVAWCRIHGIA